MADKLLMEILRTGRLCSYLLIGIFFLVGALAVGRMAHWLWQWKFWQGTLRDYIQKQNTSPCKEVLEAIKQAKDDLK